MFNWIFRKSNKPQLRLIVKMSGKTLLDICEEELRANVKWAGGVRTFGFKQLEITVAELKELNRV